MKKDQNNEAGMLTLEACISVMFFLILMLLMAGFFRMFMAQNMTAHAALETAESLSLDAYAAEKIGNEKISDASVESVNGFVNGLFDYFNDDDFFSYNDWYSSEPDEKLESAVKRRFVAYISGGDEEQADQILSRLNVKDGLKGVDFSGSSVKDGTLYVNVKYKLNYDFHVGSLSEIDVDQNACAKLWK